MRRVPPSAHIAGVMATTTQPRAWQAPANRQLQWVHDCDLALGDRGHGLLNAAGVCALRSRAGKGVWVLGARTVSSDPAWLYLSGRRLMLMLERTFRVGLAWTVFEPAGPALQKQLMSSIYGLLLGPVRERRVRRQLELRRRSGSATTAPVRMLGMVIVQRRHPTEAARPR